MALNSAQVGLDQPSRNYLGVPSGHPRCLEECNNKFFGRLVPHDDFALFLVHLEYSLLVYSLNLYVKADEVDEGCGPVNSLGAQECWCV